MDKFIQFFSGLEHRPLQRGLMFVGTMMILWIIEHAIPLVVMRYKKNKVRHAGVNLSFTLLHFIIHTLLAVFIVIISEWCARNNFGLVNWFHTGPLVTILVTMLTLDFFGGWLCHLIEHKVSLFWRFHIIHHADNNVDVTTGLRHHPLESLWRGLFFFIGLIVAGSPTWAVMVYQTFLISITGFTHANISLPKAVDKAISYILVSPNMHKIHHHWKQPYTDSNYGAVFAIWDRLFGTFLKMDTSELRYGLDRYYPNEKDEDFVALMKKPFQKLAD